MNPRWTAIALAGALVYTAVAGAEQTSQAIFAGRQAYVSFWQMGVELAGQGWCVAVFGFDGSTLGGPIDNLTIAVRVFDKDRNDKGLGRIRVDTLGGARASSRANASFDGLDIPEWKDIVSDAGSSPLCWEGVSLVFESAVGTQGGKLVDLVKHGQLRYVTPRLLKVTVKREPG
jgi:hypothetical protein